MQRIFSIALLAFAFLVGGCAEPEPRYKADMLAYDAGLIGTWRLEETDKDGKTTITDTTFEPRALAIKDGRTEQEPFNEQKPDALGVIKQPNAYVIHLHITDPENKTTDIELKGTAVTVGEITLLGAQVSVKQMEKANIAGLVLPLHFIFRVKRDGDALSVQSAEKKLAWVPEAQWIDASPTPRTLTADGDIPEGITGDIDRLLEVHRIYAKRDGFWSKPTTLHRR